ncbi:MAG: O-antigen ligase family protein [Bacteroidetes bacterium]|nr:O-antigen ligase family protein [Bacteroidota bacterium]
MRINAVVITAFGALLGFLLAYVFQYGWYFSLLIPAAVVLLYLAIYQTQFVFISLAFFTPLSVNIEEYTEGFGLFLPTEPILFGLMLLLVANKIKSDGLGWNEYKHPLFVMLFFYLSWLVISSIPSTNPLVSSKALLSKLWFVVPCLFFAHLFLTDWRAIRRFFWFFTCGMALVVVYTIVNHAGYHFGEKESHWVMSPFYKDHTIYGAAVALVTPFPVMLFFFKRQSALSSMVLLTLFIIILLGLYFSYTRAAWLSVLGAAGVFALVYFRIDFRWILLGLLAVAVVYIKFGDQIQLELARNKAEHTTESFDDRLKSATNVTTDASNLERINRWTCAIEMFKERPVFGFGLGTYAFEYARFQAPENLTIISTNFGDMGNAHSEYLSALSETGLMGLILFLGFVGTGFYYLIQLVHRSRTVNREVFVVACGILFSLSTYFIHAFLNNFLDTDKAAIPVFTMFALIVILHNFLSLQPERRI